MSWFGLTSGGGFEFAFLEGIKNIKVIKVSVHVLQLTMRTSYIVYTGHTIVSRSQTLN